MPWGVRCPDDHAVGMREMVGGGSVSLVRSRPGRELGGGDPGSGRGGSRATRFNRWHQRARFWGCAD